MVRLLALDLSLTSPGFAVIVCDNGKARLVDVIHIKTDSKKHRGERLQHIEFALNKFLNKHKPFDLVIREDFHSRIGFTQKSVFTVWGIVEALLSRFGYDKITEENPKGVKLTIAGKGTADKKEVEQGVRTILELDDKFVFKKDDESDAVAIGLAYLIHNNYIPELYKREPKKKKKTE